MKTRQVYWLPLAVILLIALPVHSAAEIEPKASGKSTFLVLYRPGPAWPEGKTIADLPLTEHFQYMISLFANGSMKFAGPLTDDSGGAVVLEVSNEADARSIVDEDPAVKTGVFLYQIHPWRLVPWQEFIRE